eukprot:m.91079 g.91079  ORF g.91079 m.91079 type:complete len:56 (+) comp8587_c1_seq1:935-1102(+)
MAVCNPAGALRCFCPCFFCTFLYLICICFVSANCEPATRSIRPSVAVCPHHLRSG